jgi:hypothetical protein
MALYISIMGSGQEAAVFKGAISSGANGTSAILIGANNATLSHLDVENTGTGSFIIGIYNASTSPRIGHVNAINSGTTKFSYGVVNLGSSPAMSNAIATATGGTSGNFGAIPRE